MAGTEPNSWLESIPYTQVICSVNISIHQRKKSGCKLVTYSTGTVPIRRYRINHPV